MDIHVLLGNAKTRLIRRPDFLSFWAQEAVKGSQGAGRVDEALDRSNAAAGAEGSEAPAPQKGSRGGPSERGRRKGRR
jgi:hypothetical protein